jgi:hypothetical protein
MIHQYNRLPGSEFGFGLEFLNVGEQNCRAVFGKQFGAHVWFAPPLQDQIDTPSEPGLF